MTFEDINRVLTSVPPFAYEIMPDIQEQIDEGYKRTVARNNERIANNNKFTISNRVMAEYILCFSGKLSGSLCEQCIGRNCCDKSFYNKRRCNSD